MPKKDVKLSQNVNGNGKRKKEEKINDQSASS